MTAAERQKIYDVKNKERHNAYMREYRRRHPERSARHVRNSTMKAKYGITAAEHDAMWERQGQRCAACRTDTNAGRRWSIDHDHDTGRVRGLLCMKCNTALGMLNDSPERVAALLAYLEVE